MSDASVPNAAEQRRSLLPLWGVFLVCAIPLLAAILAYVFDLRPQVQTNYGLILDPQRDVPPLDLRTIDGEPFDFGRFKGQWVMVSADLASCDEACATKLFIMRQTRASTGRNAQRIDRVWFVLDDAPVNPAVISAYQGMYIVRASREQLTAWLPGRLEGHIWMVDPLHNLMMQWPEEPDVMRLREDIGKLLHASRVG